MLKVPTKCPICGKPTYVAVVKCDHCGTTVNNKFGYSAFDKLDERQLEFVTAFIECDGSIKEMERRFDISYPTVKARLGEIKKQLGLTAAEKSYRLTVLEDLQKGAIGADEALRLIKKNDENR